MANMEQVRENELPVDELNEMEERRVERLNEAGIDEHAVLKSAKMDVGQWDAYFNQNISTGKDDVRFAVEDQWTGIERSEFNRLFKPAMTFNKIYDSVKKILGEERKNKPDLIVRSLTGKATQEQINIREDLIRSICYQSQNDLVYQTAFKSALLMGYGAFQITLDYESPKSFNQVIRYELIPDVTRVGFDPKAVKPHKGDGNFCYREYRMSKEEFYATYPYVTNPVSFFDPRVLNDVAFATQDSFLICEYYRKEWFSMKVHKLSNGKNVTDIEWKEMQKGFKQLKKIAASSQVVGDIIMNDIPKIVSTRQSQDYRIMQYRCMQNQIIEFTEWPSKQLPIVFVDGDSVFIEGMQQTKSFIRDAKDAQRFINYVGSEIAAEVKNRRREQWIGTPDNIIGNEQMWRNPELQNGILIAKPDPKTGAMPIKMPAWEMSQSLLAQYQRGTQDIKEILGFYDEMQGAESNAQSGVAIANRQIASSMSAYIFRDNLNQAIEQGGRVVLDLLPVVYGNEERHVVISKKDGSSESMILNKMDEHGNVKKAMGDGEYDIEIDAGPSFAVQKAASVQMLIQLVQTNPQVFPLVADLIAKNLDVSFGPQISERFKSLVPPQVLAKEEGKPMPPQQPNPQEQMAQMQMQMAQKELQLKQQHMAEREAKMQLEQQEHEMEKVKLSLDAQKMMMDVQNDKSTNEMQKAKLMVELQRIASDAHQSHQDRLAGLHKAHLDHEAKMSKGYM
jgi:hypothetical protein